MKLNKNFFKMSTPLIMGVCNITKDSFSDGGKYYKNLSALDHIKKMYKNGANIIDIGAESTRPGSDPVSYKYEIKKIGGLLDKLPKNKFIISIDTNKIETQEYVLKKGAHLINDIMGGSEELFYLSKKFNSGLIIMHTPAAPKIMQTKTKDYKNIYSDIKNYFKKRIRVIEKYKISQKKVWLDPGIGFGKNVNQNLKLIKNIKKFRINNYGLLLGTSRKSWISNIHKSDVNNRLGGSLASIIYSLNNSVDMYRVHDVFETIQAIKVYNKIKCSR